MSDFKHSLAGRIERENTGYRPLVGITWLDAEQNILTAYNYHKEFAHLFAVVENLDDRTTNALIDKVSHVAKHWSNLDGADTIVSLIAPSLNGLETVCADLLRFKCDLYTFENNKVILRLNLNGLEDITW